MWSEAQIQYLEDVLGASPSHFLASAVEAVPEIPEVAVVTPSLGSEERALLDKILGSIQLRDYELFEGREEQPFARHILHFNSASSIERIEDGESVVWNFPLLEEMIGASPEVAARKKGTWALLQRFAKERS
jgi:hypothetical protein